MELDGKNKRKIVLDQSVISRLLIADEKLYSKFVKYAETNEVVWLINEYAFYSEFGRDQNHAEKLFNKVIKPMRNIYFCPIPQLYETDEVRMFAKKKLGMPMDDKEILSSFTPFDKENIRIVLNERYTEIRKTFSDLMSQMHIHLSGLILQLRNAKLTKEYRNLRNKGKYNKFDELVEENQEKIEGFYEGEVNGTKLKDVLPKGLSVIEFNKKSLEVFAGYEKEVRFVFFFGYLLSLFNENGIESLLKIRELFEKYLINTKLCPYFTIFYNYIESKGETLTANDLMDIYNLTNISHAHVIFMDKKNRDYLQSDKFIESFKSEKNDYKLLFMKIHCFEEFDNIDEMLARNYVKVDFN